MKYRFAVLMIACFLFLAGCGHEAPAGETTVPAISQTTAAPTTEALHLYGENIDTAQLHFYEFTQACTFAHSHVWVEGEDFVSMSREEALAFYGLSADVTEVLPQAETGPGWNDYGVYFNEESGYYSTENVFTYEFPAGGKITLILTREEPMNIFAPEVYENPTYSYINDREVLLGRYSGEKTEIYVQLTLGDTHVLIRFRDMAEEDILDVLDYLTFVNK